MACYKPCIRGFAARKTVSFTGPQGEWMKSDLNLNVEHSLSVDLQAKGLVNVMCEPFLVLLLDCCPLLDELGIVDVVEQTLRAKPQDLPLTLSVSTTYLELGKVLEEISFR